MDPADFLRQITDQSPEQAAARALAAGMMAHVLPSPQDLPQLAAAARAIAASLGRGAPAVLLLAEAKGATATAFAPLLLGYDRIHALAPLGPGAGLIAPGAPLATPLPDSCTLLAVLILPPAPPPAAP